ncbi:MAG: LCP family protein [Nitriliruptor sp.]|uniref:LCP family protein n=1 Tax=Nitriliruptor sp. TaxID=2448056 RepID=UPI0034A09F15
MRRHDGAPEVAEEAGARRTWTSGARAGWGRRVATIVGVLVVAVALVVGASVWSIDRSIDRVDVQGLGQDDADGDGGGAGDGAAAEELDARALTVLVLGSDSREDLTPRERRELRTGYVPGARAEVVALTRLDPDADEVRVLSVPRDSRVELCDGSTGRVNESFQIGEDLGIGGESCTVQTLTRLTGLRIDHVVGVDFGGFVEVVDALGGVTMRLDEPLKDRDANLDLPAGCVDLDGTDALAFARARHLDDDFGRIARQQRLVAEMLDGIGELGILDDLPRLLRVAERVAAAVELDSTLDLRRIQQLVREHRATVAGDLEGRFVPGVITMIGAASMVELDEEALEELVRWLISGQDERDGTVRDTGRDDASGEGRSEVLERRGGGEEQDGGDEVLGGPTTLDGSRPVGLADEDEIGRC